MNTKGDLGLARAAVVAVTLTAVDADVSATVAGGGGGANCGGGGGVKPSVVGDDGTTEAVAGVCAIAAAFAFAAATLLVLGIDGAEAECWRGTTLSAGGGGGASCGGGGISTTGLCD